VTSSIIDANRAHKDLKDQVSAALALITENGPEARDARGKLCRGRVETFAPGIYPTAQILVDLMGCRDDDLIKQVLEMWSKKIKPFVSSNHSLNIPLANLLPGKSAHTLQWAERIGFDLSTIKDRCLNYGLQAPDPLVVFYLAHRFDADLFNSVGQLGGSIIKCHPACADALGDWIDKHAHTLPLGHYLQNFIHDVHAVNGEDMALRVMQIFSQAAPQKVAESSLTRMPCNKSQQILDNLRSNHGRMQFFQSRVHPAELLRKNQVSQSA